MLKKLNTNRRFLYCLAFGLVALCCVVWLIFVLKNAGGVPANQFNDQLTQLPLTASSVDEQADDSFEPIKEVAIDNLDMGQCSARCRSVLSMIDRESKLADETVGRLESYAKELAAYLQGDESKRQHFLDIALTTTDTDKRRLLTNIFQHLPLQQKAELGESFIASDNWRIRADGVGLIAGNDIPNSEVANSLMDSLLNEENSYVKSSILTHLKQSSSLQGDAEILQKLDSLLYSETDGSVRTTALKAKMELSEKPYHILPDALQALRSTDPDFQWAGLLAIDKVMLNEDEYIKNGAYIDRNSIKKEIQIIRDSTAYNDKKRYDRLVREAGTIYSRYFEN